MFELVFVDRKTGLVKYAITDVATIRYVTPSEVGFVAKRGTNHSCPFPYSEKLEINRLER
jgi:hypothetical protein